MGLNEKKVNPWAVCHASTGPKKSAKFERCVKKVKKNQGIEEMQTLDLISNKIVEGLQFRLEEQQLIEDIMLFCEQNEIDIDALNEEELNEFIGQMLSNLAAGKGFRTDAGVLKKTRSVMGQDPNLRRQMAKHRLTARGFNTSNIPGGVSNDEFKRQQRYAGAYGKVAPSRSVPPPLPTAKAPAGPTEPPPLPTAKAPAGPGAMVSPEQAAEKKAAAQARLKTAMHQKLGGQGGYGGGAKAVMGGGGSFMPTANIRQRSTADAVPYGGSISRRDIGGKATARLQRKYADRFAMPQRASIELFGQKIVEGIKSLTRKQKKLDVNKSGSLDSQDFKMLRAGKKKVAESSLVELKKETYQNYAKKAAAQIDSGKTPEKKELKRIKGIGKAETKVAKASMGPNNPKNTFKPKPKLNQDYIKAGKKGSSETPMSTEKINQSGVGGKPAAGRPGQTKAGVLDKKLDKIDATSKAFMGKLAKNPKNSQK